MAATKLTNLEVEEDLEVGGDLKLNGGADISEDGTVGGGLTVTGALAAASLAGASVGAQSITAADDYVPGDDEKKALYMGFTVSAASKTVTLGLAEGQITLVHNTGDTNAFTLKNVAGDSGTSLGTGKVVLVVGSATGDASVVLALN
jgi:hypothetical protein